MAIRSKLLIPILFFFAFTASAHTFAVNADGQIDTAQSQFGGASGLFDGTGDYITAPDSTDFNLSADFTISLWVRFNAEGTFGLTATENGGGTGWQFYVVTNGGSPSLHVWSGAGTDRNNAWDPTTNTWYHVALVRSGTTVTMFIDGTSIGTVADGDFNNDSGPLGVATASGNAINAVLNGWIDELTIQKGTARWTGNFTPPASEDDQCILTNVKVLLHMNGADASTTFTDDSVTACGGGSTADSSEGILIQQW